MFVGAIDAEFRQWLFLNRNVFRDRTVFVGCSGNFTIEQIIGPYAGAVHSNDVGIYSHVAGHWLADQSCRLDVKDPAWEWLLPWIEKCPPAVTVLLFEMLRTPPTSFYNKRVFAKHHTACEPGKYLIIDDDGVEKITVDSPVVIKRVPGKEINYYKNRFMKKTIQFTDGPFNYFFFVDGLLFGFCVLTFQKFGREGLYILSDFVVACEKSTRLAKLLLLCLQSKELREMIEGVLISHVELFVTTAFTEMPVSMKYRGVFELAKRGVGPDGVAFLNYRTATGLHSTAEAVKKWLKFKRSAKGNRE